MGECGCVGECMYVSVECARECVCVWVGGASEITLHYQQASECLCG